MTPFQLSTSFATALFLMSCASKKSHIEQSPSGAIPQPPAVKSSDAARVQEEPPVVEADPAAEHDSPTSALSDDKKAYERARPVFQKYCGKCHTEQSGKRTALKHFVMDSYPFGGHHTANMPATIRKVLGQDGKRATMPRDKPGIVQGDDLKLILEWADAAERTRTSTPPDTHESHEHH